MVAFLTSSFRYIRAISRCFLRIAPHTAAFFVLLTSATAEARPEPLREEEGCELWVGTASGNDPSVLVELHICPQGSGVAGHLQWSSTRSGWNRRAVQGAWEGGTLLSLSDLRLVENRPLGSWYFCLIDSYELRRVGPDRLAGSYRSVACRDNARMNLRRRDGATAGSQPTGEAPRVPEHVQEPGGQPGPGPTPSPSPVLPIVPEADEPNRPGGSSFGLCSVSPGSRASLLGMVILSLLWSPLLLVRARHRRIGR